MRGPRRPSRAAPHRHVGAGPRRPRRVRRGRRHRLPPGGRRSRRGVARGQPRSARRPPRRPLNERSRQRFVATVVTRRIASATASGASTGTNVETSGTSTSLGVGEHLGEPMGRGEREAAIGGAPHQAHGAGEAVQARGHVDELLAVDATGEAGDVPPDPSIGQRRADPLPGARLDAVGAAAARSPAASGAPAAAASVAACARERGVAGGDEQRHERLRREVLERVAVRQHEAPDATGVGVDNELADRPAGVVADERDVVQVERLEEGDDEPGDAARREIGSRPPAGMTWAPSGQSGEVRPHAGGRQPLGDPSHSVLSTRKPWTNTTGGLARRRGSGDAVVRWIRREVDRRHGVLLYGCVHHCRQVTYTLHVSQAACDADRAARWTAPPPPVRRSSTRPATLFAEHGFADVGTERIARAAGVTRGALYHQFADKIELFAAVLEAVEEDVTARLIVVDGGRRLRRDPRRSARRRHRRLARRLRRPRGPAHRRCSTARPCSAGSAGGRSAMRHGLGLVDRAPHRARGRRGDPRAARSRRSRTC